MPVGLIDKLTSFLVPELEDNSVYESAKETKSSSKHHLKLHSSEALNFVIVTPQTFDEVESYAKHLKKNVAVIVNIEKINTETQRRIFDYLNGVSYILGVNVEKISDNALMYVPGYITICKELYAYSVPTYVKTSV